MFWCIWSMSDFLRKLSVSCIIPLWWCHKSHTMSQSFLKRAIVHLQPVRLEWISERYLCCISDHCRAIHPSNRHYHPSEDCGSTASLLSFGMSIAGVARSYCQASRWEQTALISGSVSHLSIHVIKLVREELHREEASAWGHFHTYRESSIGAKLPLDRNQEYLFGFGPVVKAAAALWAMRSIDDMGIRLWGVCIGCMLDGVRQDCKLWFCTERDEMRMRWVEVGYNENWQIWDFHPHQ